MSSRVNEVSGENLQDPAIKNPGYANDNACYIFGSRASDLAYNHRRQRRRGRDPPIFDLQGSWCVDDPQYFDKYFIFFPSAKLLNTASRCHFQQHLSHHFEIEKFINFLGRGAAPPQTPPLRCLRRLDSRVFGARPATPNVPVALTPMLTESSPQRVELDVKVKNLNSIALNAS